MRASAIAVVVDPTSRITTSPVETSEAARVPIDTFSAACSAAVSSSGFSATPSETGTAPPRTRRSRP